MFGGFFDSLRDSLRHRFGRHDVADAYRATADEERAALGRHNDAEARIVGRTLGEANELRAFGKGQPR